MTREEALVAVLTLAAGQQLDAALDLLTVALAVWAAVAVLVGGVTWAATR